jgi:hypothetical protein
MLDDVLKYHELPESAEFVAAVMHVVERQQKQQQQKRRRILLWCGLIGALFGAVGAWQLAEPLGSLSAQWLAALDTQWLADRSALANGVVLLAFVGALGWLLLEEFLPAA